MDDDAFLGWIAGELGSLPHVEAVALGGSRATGDARPTSDWDLAVYYRGRFDPGALRAKGWPGEVGEVGRWGGGVMNGGAWLTVEDRRVDVHYRDLDDVERRVAEAQEGHFQKQLLLGYLAGIPTYVPVAELALNVVLVGELPRPTYPPALAAEAGRRWAADSAHSLAYARSIAEGLGDRALAAGNGVRGLVEAAHARLARRRVWVLNEKRILARAGLEPLAEQLALARTAPELAAALARVEAELAVRSEGAPAPATPGFVRTTALRVLACGPERATEVHRLTAAAFAPHVALDPPSGAVRETVERVQADLAGGGGAIAERGGRAVGCLRWSLDEGGDLHVRRLAVDPSAQGTGVGTALVAWAESEARHRGRAVVRLGVRLALPDNLAFFERLGYRVVSEHRHEGHPEPTWLGLRKDVVDPIFADPRLAAVYDALDPDRRDLDAYVGLAEELDVRSVLDVGCGTGTFALLLAGRGLDVTGVDPAAASLAVARSKPGAERVRWVLGDATALPPLQVDLATMTGNAAQAIVEPLDWQATLAGTAAALRPGGWLVFETRDPAAEGWRAWHREASYRTAEVEGVGRVERWVDLLEVALPLVRFRTTWRFDADGALLTSESTLRFRSHDEVVADLERAGFGVEVVRGAPDRPGQELVFVARRPPPAPPGAGPSGSLR